MKGNKQYPSKDPMFRLEQEMRIRNFSKKTIASYLYYIKELQRFANYKQFREINRQDIKNYLDFLFSQGKSEATVNVAINSLKFYFDKILNRKFFVSDIGIKRPKKAKKLPVVLSKQEIVKMIDVSGNIKHKLMIQILYSSGLRVSELINLEINDIDFHRRTIKVKQGKGKKDRITITSRDVLKNIDKYIKEFRPLRYLFEGYEPGKKISARSAQKVIRETGKRAGIKKNVSAHTLRHSFATHLLENNVNLRYIQSMLGHARLETTQIYTKVAVNKFREIEDLL